MKKLSLLSASVFLALLGCDSEPAKNTSGGKNQDVKIEELKSVDSNFYAARPTINSWPESNEDALDMADDLTATNYYLVLDGSGSMAESRCSGNTNKMTAAKQAVATFTKQIPQQANMGLFVFDNQGTNERVALGPNNRDSMLQAIGQVRANGGTPLKSAIKQGYQSLEKQAKKQLGYGEYHLVVITDGEASGNQNPKRVVRTILEDSPIVIHTIGFCIEGGHSLNQAGRINYKQANDPSSLQQGLQDVLAEAPSFQQEKFDG